MKRLIPILLVLSACSLPLKQQVSAVHLTVHQTLVALDDAERAYCKPSPAQPNHCTATPVVVSDANHQKLSGYFVSAYEADKKVGTAIIAWQPNAPLPTDLPTLFDDARQTLATVTSFAPQAGASSLVTKATAFLDAVAKLQDLLQKKGGAQ